MAISKYPPPVLISFGGVAVAQSAPPGKKIDRPSKADCSSEAEHANRLQTSRDGQRHQDLGGRLCRDFRN